MFNVCELFVVEVEYHTITFFMLKLIYHLPRAGMYLLRYGCVQPRVINLEKLSFASPILPPEIPTEPSRYQHTGQQ